MCGEPPQDLRTVGQPPARPTEAGRRPSWTSSATSTAGITPTASNVSLAGHPLAIGHEPCDTTAALNHPLTQYLPRKGRAAAMTKTHDRVGPQHALPARRGTGPCETGRAPAPAGSRGKLQEPRPRLLGSANPDRDHQDHRRQGQIQDSGGRGTGRPPPLVRRQCGRHHH
jgi:hypothetical protein